jgi:hypothetical protein
MTSATDQGIPTDQGIRRQRRRGVRILGFAIRALILLGTDALALVVMTALLSASDALSFPAAVVVAATMALINAVLWPLVTRLALPLTIITFGLGRPQFRQRRARVLPGRWEDTLILGGPGDRVRAGPGVNDRGAAARRRW